MASLPAAVDKLRRHLRGAIPDNGDLQLADGYLLDVINSIPDDPDSDVGEPEGKRRTASGETPRAADWRGNVGLDSGLAFVFDTRTRRSPAGLEDILKHGAPPRVETVR